MMNKQKIISLTLMGAISLGSCMPAMAMQASDAPVGGSSSQNKSEEGNIATLKARYEEARKAYHQASNLFASVFVEAREEAERKCELAKKAALAAAEIELKNAKEAYEIATDNYEKGVYEGCEQEKEALEAAKETLEKIKIKLDEMRYDVFWGDPDGHVEKAKTAKAEHIKKVIALEEAEKILNAAKGSAGEEEAKRKCEQAEAECREAFEVFKGILEKEYQAVEREYDFAEGALSDAERAFEEAKNRVFEKYEAAKAARDAAERAIGKTEKKAYDEADKKCEEKRLAYQEAEKTYKEAQAALSEATAERELIYN